MKGCMKKILILFSFLISLNLYPTEVGVEKEADAKKLAENNDPSNTEKFLRMQILDKIAGGRLSNLTSKYTKTNTQNNIMNFLSCNEVIKTDKKIIGLCKISEEEFFCLDISGQLFICKNDNLKLMCKFNFGEISFIDCPLELVASDTICIHTEDIVFGFNFINGKLFRLHEREENQRIRLFKLKNGAGLSLINTIYGNGEIHSLLTIQNIKFNSKTQIIAIYDYTDHTSPYIITTRFRCTESGILQSEKIELFSSGVFKISPIKGILLKPEDNLLGDSSRQELHDKFLLQSNFNEIEVFCSGSKIKNFVLEEREIIIKPIYLNGKMYYPGSENGILVRKISQDFDIAHETPVRKKAESDVEVERIYNELIDL